MDIKRIKAIVELVKESGIAELEISEGENKLKICTYNKNVNTEMYNHKPITHVITNDRDRDVQHNMDQNSIENSVIYESSNIKYIKSPMVGAFYSSPNPGKPPFVEVGQQVKVGQVLCIIEAMKLMNRIESDQDGIIKEVLLSDGSPVEFGQNLYIIE